MDSDSDNDITKKFDIHNQINRDMYIPNQIGPYSVRKVVEETKSSLLISALDEDRKIVAIKCINHCIFNPNLPDILGKLNHPNILPTYNIFCYPDEKKQRFHGIVMPLAETDLFHYFFTDKRGFLSERSVCQIMQEALSAVSYFHSLGYCHSDLKIENFLVMNSKTQPKILLIDFDLTFKLPNGYMVKACPRGSLPNSAPELLKDDCLEFHQEVMFTNKIDTWSMGVMLYILLARKHPFQNSEKHYDIKLIKAGDCDYSDRAFPNVSMTARKLIFKMLKPDPNERITIEEALEDDWFKQFTRNRFVAPNRVVRIRGEDNDYPLDG